MVSTVVTSSALKPPPANQLISSVARSVGKENNTNSRAEALEYINDIIDELNTYQPWESLRYSLLQQSFVASTASYDMGTAIFKVEAVYITKQSDDSRVRDVPERRTGEQSVLDPGNISPAVTTYTLYNIHADSKLTFWSGPTAAMVADDYFNIDYVRRIPHLAKESDTLDVPAEFSIVLKEGGKYLMRDNLLRKNDTKTVRTFARYQQLLHRLRISDRRRLNSKRRWMFRGGSVPGALPPSVL